MEEKNRFLLAESDRETRMKLLADCNETANRFGLDLSERDLQVLQERRRQALRGTGRVEFGGGVLPELADAFCDSPHISPKSWLETLCELQDAFYYFKGEAAERIPDDQLIGIMRRYFDEVCEGSLDYLCGTMLEDLCRDTRYGVDRQEELDNWRWNI